MKYLYLLVLPIIIFTLSGCCKRQHCALSEREYLGKMIFNDSTLSEPSGQSCATCHTDRTGFADIYLRPISEGAVRGLFSDRNSMTTSYAAFVPPLTYDPDEEHYVGGLFWDGRVNTLEEQASMPFVNPLEMANPNKSMVVEKIKKAPYYTDLMKLYGETNDPELIFHYVTDALASYERSVEMSPFSSKFDAYIAGKCELSDDEHRGMELFEDKGKCAECHIMDPDPIAGRILFTDHTYDNLGIPRNPENPHYNIPTNHNPVGADYLDLGLGKTVGKDSENGKFRVPTLRNVALTAPYGHNGYFRTLEDITHFYNSRDVDTTFAPAEYSATVNTDELGNLKLTPEEERLIIEFMKTLTDGYNNQVK